MGDRSYIDQKKHRIREFEATVLGMILMDNGVIEVCERQLSTSDFGYPVHRQIYDIVLSLYADAAPVNITTVYDRVVEERLTDTVSAEYVSRLTDSVATTANVEYYIKEIRKAARKRRLMNVARRAQNQITDGVDDEEVVTEMENALLELGQGEQTNSYMSFHAAMMSASHRIYQMKEQGSGMFVAKTGIRSLDRLLGGLEAEDYMVVGARPSVGKSALALQMGMDIAGKQGKKVAIFTAEMAYYQLAVRAVSQECRIDSRKIRNGKITEHEMEKIKDFGGKLQEYRLFVNDTPNIPLTDLKTQARTIKQREGLDVIIVDYLTLIRGNQRLQRWEMVTEISSAMKELARELDVANIVLSQVGRHNDNKRPSLGDLRESGAIEQDADIVMFLHRAAEPQFDSLGMPYPVPVEAILAKNRNGSVGTVPLSFIPQYTRFEEPAEEDENGTVY